MGQSHRKDQKKTNVWGERFKLGSTINSFTAIENSCLVTLQVLIEESQRVCLGNMEVVKALLVVQFRSK
ncbi:hypothetical protein BDD14_3282 [Edaphobacter modestus]|uniref:Uncharacterized protein n=1 Tax=Edaphobacter modestus TaxID=388466 RepID=A0A4Q7YXD3_9BACT|nr:hypothetical protein BDD14_3282 [Edaphobacter modestus]